MIMKQNLSVLENYHLSFFILIISFAKEKNIPLFIELSSLVGCTAFDMMFL